MEPWERSLGFAGAVQAGLALAVAGLACDARAEGFEPALPTHLALLAAAEVAPAENDLGFDLLGETPKPKPVDATAIKVRRTLLNLHQGLGIGLLTFTASLCVVGQLSYQDRFAENAPSTGRFEAPHAVLAYSTLGLFTVTALTALFAPLPFERERGRVDRTLLHKIGLFTATAAMAAEGTLGILTVSREGFTNQRDLAQAHLVLGYAAFAAMVLGVSAMVF